MYQHKPETTSRKTIVILLVYYSGFKRLIIILQSSSTNYYIRLIHKDVQKCCDPAFILLIHQHFVTISMKFLLDCVDIDTSTMYHHITYYSALFIKLIYQHWLFLQVQVHYSHIKFYNHLFQTITVDTSTLLFAVALKGTYLINYSYLER